jgi:hypothetical protein
MINMRKILIAVAFIVLTSFGTQEPKTVTVTFTLEEIQVVYDALGELPAKKVEQIRYKIFMEAQKQLADTIKKK